MRLPISIALRPSRQLPILFGVVHAAAVATLFPLAIPLWLKTGIALLVGVSLLVGLRRLQTNVYRLRLQRDGLLGVTRKVDTDEALYEVATATRLGALIVLALNAGEIRMPLLLWQDMMSPDDMRRLRIWLMWRKKTG